MKLATVLTVCVLLGGYALAEDKLILKEGLDFLKPKV